MLSGGPPYERLCILEQTMSSFVAAEKMFWVSGHSRVSFALQLRATDATLSCPSIAICTHSLHWWMLSMVVS